MYVDAERRQQGHAKPRSDHRVNGTIVIGTCRNTPRTILRLEEHQWMHSIGQGAVRDCRKIAQPLGREDDAEDEDQDSSDEDGW